MTDSELNKLLRSARVPERNLGYWTQFSKRVIQALENRTRVTVGRSRTNLSAWCPVETLCVLLRRPAFALGMSMLLVAIAFMFWTEPTAGSADQEQLRQAAKYFREIESLFPNQVQAIVFDDRGPHLILADRANVARSKPLYLKLCGVGGCQRFVTFSGQSIRFKGQQFEILCSARGEVLVVGEETVWSSRDKAAQFPFKVEARSLQAAS